MRSSSSPASPSVMKSLLLGSMVLNMLVLFYWFFSASQPHADPSAATAAVPTKSFDKLDHSELLGVLKDELHNKHLQHSDSVQSNVQALTDELARLKALVDQHKEEGHDEPASAKKAASSAYGAGRGGKDATNYSLCHKTLTGRGDLPAYLNELGLVGQAVEIGVRRGHFSSHMLKNWKGKTLVGIGVRCVVSYVLCPIYS